MKVKNILDKYSNSKNLKSENGESNLFQMNQITCTIDIGDKHTAICFSRKQKKFFIYLFSVLETDINEKMKSIRKHLDEIFDYIGDETKKVIIEKQMN